MIDKPRQIDNYYDQKKIKHHRQPERADPDKDVADHREPDFLHKSADDIRKRQKYEKNQVRHSESRPLRNRVPAPNENIIIHRSIDGKHDAEKDDEVDGFHNSCFNLMLTGYRVINFLWKENSEIIFEKQGVLWCE